MTPPVNGKPYFDEFPIKVGGFELRSRSAVPVVEAPTLRGTSNALKLALDFEDSSPYWPGDILAYAESRAEWRDKLDQLRGITKLAKHTLENKTTVCRKVTGRARELSPSMSHSAAVTKLAAPEQEQWLEKASTENWTVRELEKEIQASARANVISGQATRVHQVELTVSVAVEAADPYAAEHLAWDFLTQLLKQHWPVAGGPMQPLLSGKVTAARTCGKAEAVPA